MLINGEKINKLDWQKQLSIRMLIVTVKYEDNGNVDIVSSLLFCTLQQV